MGTPSFSVRSSTKATASSLAILPRAQVAASAIFGSLPRANSMSLAVDLPSRLRRNGVDHAEEHVAVQRLQPIPQGRQRLFAGDRLQGVAGDLRVLGLAEHFRQRGHLGRRADLAKLKADHLASRGRGVRRFENRRQSSRARGAGLRRCHGVDHLLVDCQQRGHVLARLVIGQGLPRLIP